MKRVVMIVVLIILVVLCLLGWSSANQKAQGAIGKTYDISPNLTFKVSSVDVWGQTVTGCVSTPKGIEFNWGENSIYTKLINHNNGDSIEKVKMVVKIGNTEYTVDRQHNEICP